LRTPVAALVTTLEVALRRPRDSADLTRIARSCLADARMLRQGVEGLMEHARGQADPNKDVAEEFDLSALLNQCCDVVESLAQGREVTLVRSIAPGLFMNSQPRRIRGIAMNLLGNAVEYNRSGGRVELIAEPVGSEVQISVADTGCGISADQLLHVFQPFYRASERNSASQLQDDASHMGLGLFLVDSHVKALNGKCRINSKLNVGTTIAVKLSGLILREPAKLKAAVL